ncbi:hypothetical protein AZE42_02809 [Rhizopogon vesiculosus]|uniref:Zn(2)-C6 fungal-type domain-containing protein n=1 Tax=Rhizopogon vesiculosus TaxID=180088 RepID=A0A1J8Q9I6_9AGAM|nr:hypothetical protein AZE42_02809 [Rhizopogon vesiculosus]
MVQLPPHFHQTFSDPDTSLTTFSDLAGLFENMSDVRMKLPHARVAHACDHCRRLKTKCSGQQPECASCQRKGRVCEWTPLKTSKLRRSRKPYDAWIPYQPPIAPKAKVLEQSRVATPRPTYPNVMLPWSIGGTILSLAQAASMATAPMVETMVQEAFTDWSVPRQYGYQEGLDIHDQWTSSPPSSCPSSSSRSDSSSCESAPPLTPKTPTSTSPSFSPTEEPQMPSDADMEAFFHQLYRCISPMWSSPASNEFEKLFAP